MTYLNSKIIGFTVAPHQIDHGDVDIFKSGLRLIEKKHQGFHLSIWGIGDIEKCFIDEHTFTLSFPLTSSLEERNIVVKFTENGFFIENDWLGSIPLFYNPVTKRISTLVRKVIDSPLFDKEGLSMYLDLGYSALEKTPIRNVFFLRFYSSFTLTQNDLSVLYKEDPVPNHLKRETTSNEMITSLTSLIREMESKVEGEVILPLSGGFDSRFIASSVKDLSRFKAFTYGLSDKQEESIETVRAKKVAEILGIDWTQIPLGRFNTYAEEWFFLFGPATQLHGMYHMEFYSQIRDHLSPDNRTLVSGIIGDAWSGHVKIPEIKNAKDILNLGYSHGMHSSRKVAKNEGGFKNAETLFGALHKELLSHSFRVVMSMRFKILLLSYLMSVPDYFGTPSWTPFLNMKIACGLLSLPEEERKNRAWEVAYFKEKGIDVDSMKLSYAKQNSLNYQSLRMRPLRALDVEILRPYFKKGKIEEVNRRYLKLVSGKVSEQSFIPRLMRTRLFAGLGRRLHFSYNYLKPYYEIITLKSLEYTLREHTET